MSTAHKGLTVLTAGPEIRVSASDIRSLLLCFSFMSAALSFFLAESQPRLEIPFPPNRLKIRKNGNRSTAEWNRDLGGDSPERSEAGGPGGSWVSFVTS